MKFWLAPLLAFSSLSLVGCGGPTGGPTKVYPPVVFDQTPPANGVFCQPFQYQFQAHGGGGVTFYIQGSSSILGMGLDETGLLHGTPMPPADWKCGDTFTLSVTPNGSAKVEIFSGAR